MTAPDKPKAPPTQRVSDSDRYYDLVLRRLSKDDPLWEIAQRLNHAPKNCFGQPLDMSWEHKTILELLEQACDTQTALAVRDARIAELEAERDEALRWDYRTVTLGGMSLLEQVNRAREQRDELAGDLVETNARADRLEAQLQAARATGTREDGLRDTLQAVLTWAEQRCPCENETPDPCPLCDASVAEGRCLSAENTIPRRLLQRVKNTLAIRARLTAPAEPTADTGEKG